MAAAAKGAQTRKTCYYEVLGVERTVELDDLKKAYKKSERVRARILFESATEVHKCVQNIALLFLVFLRAALRWHPDKNAGSEEASAKFKEIREVRILGKQGSGALLSSIKPCAPLDWVR
jgi:hypothetical protein